MSLLSDAVSRLTGWISADRREGRVNPLSLEQIAAVQLDVELVLDVMSLSDCQDQRLSYTNTDDIILYLVWNLQPGRPQIVAVCSSTASGEKYRSFVEERGGCFHIEMVVMDHAFGRNDIQTITYGTPSRGGRCRPRKPLA